MERAGSERPPGGFSLPELMLVVVLLGILSAISVPVLKGVVSMAYRVHADQVLATVATDLVENRFGAGTFRLPDAGDSTEGLQKAQTDNPLWRLRFQSADRTGFLITADPVGDTVQCPALGWTENGRIAGSPVCRRSGSGGSGRTPVNPYTPSDPGPP